LSISADISNELAYRFPQKLVAVVYVKGAKANISMRGKGARDIILKAIEGLENASAGGHEVAVGGQVKIEDLEIFRERIEKIISSTATIKPIAVK
jgi:single-stranded DNA-specific DHH superfamily exonuclease